MIADMTGQEQQDERCRAAAMSHAQPGRRRAVRRGRAGGIAWRAQQRHEQNHQPADHPDKRIMVGQIEDKEKDAHRRKQRRRRDRGARAATHEQRLAR